MQDNFTYNYTAGTNRLASLSGSSPTTYTYDDNGNVTGDSYRGIAFIIYDPDNLPVTVYTTSGQTQVYAYDVNGSRVRKLAGSSDTYYVNAPDGKKEAVNWAPYGYNYTYNIFGNDNIGQVRVNGTVNRYYI